MTEQAILDVFRRACGDEEFGHRLFDDMSVLRSRLRTIKDLFLKRDYAAIFYSSNTLPAPSSASAGSEANQSSEEFNGNVLLPVYVAEYSPSRALCYNDLFANSDHLKAVISKQNAYIYSIGAGSGGELVGITAAASAVVDFAVSKPTIHIQDIGDYSPIMTSVEACLRSSFASKDQPRIIRTMSQDILGSENKALVTATLQQADLVTAMFITNELLASSKKEFVGLVKLLVSSMKAGALLLVVDSAGSFSEVQVGSAKGGGKGKNPTAKGDAPTESTNSDSTYMVYHLLDAINAFEILDKTDSRWYRFPVEANLSYPLKLNNMRYFMRIYRKR